MTDILNNPTAHGKVGRQGAKSLFEDGTYDIEEFHDTFLELEDPTEYKPALKLVGSWREWQRIKRDWKGFNGHIQDWKEELEVKLKSKAIEQINTLAYEERNYQASKWLAEEGYNKRAGAGRPSKSELARRDKEIADKAAVTKSDKARVLSIVNGTPE